MEENIFTPVMLQNIFSKHGHTISRWINAEIQLATSHVQPSAVFSSDEALRLFGKLRKAGLLDQNNMPNSLSLAQKGVLADEIARRLNISHTWVEFSKLWKINPETLRCANTKAKKQSNIEEFRKQVKKALE